MLGGYQEIVVVEKATATIRTDLEKIVGENQLVLAKQIVVATQGKNEGTTNTFEKIGQGAWSDKLIQQTESEKIKNAPDNVLYIILSGKLNASELSDQLNQKGNTAHPFSNAQQLVLLKQMLFVPQSFITLSVLLIAFSTLILSIYISLIKKNGILRLSGYSSKAFIWQLFRKDLLYLTLLLLLSVVVLNLLFLGSKLWTLLNFEISLVSLFILWGLLVATEAFISMLTGYIFSKQAIGLAIKGKAPLKGILVLNAFLQVISILSIVLAVSQAMGLQKELDSLKAGAKSWAKNADYYGLTYILASPPSNEGEKIFYTELLKDSDNLMVVNQLDNQIFYKNGADEIANPGGGGYYPSQFPDQNMIFVNYNYLKKEKVQLSGKMDEKLQNLKSGEFALLVPESLKSESGKITAAWKKMFEAPDSADKDSFHMTQIAGEYSDAHDLFVYPMYGVANQLANQSFVKSPLIVVYDPSTFRSQDIGWIQQYGYQMLFKNPEKVRQLVDKYHISDIGAFANGYSSILTRMENKKNQMATLYTTAVLATLGSILLSALVSKIYLYQGRRKYFLQRLSGLSYLRIHGNYLLMLAGGSLLITLISLVMHSPTPAILAIWINLVITILLLTFQVYKEKRRQIEVIKGGD
jgi:putative ABC transport system permease protein